MGQIENTWKKFKTSIKKAAGFEFPRRKTLKNLWFNEDYQKMVTERKRAEVNVLNEQKLEAEEEHTSINMETSCVLRREKRKFIDSKITKAAEDRTKYNTKDFHRTVRFVQKGYQQRSFGTKDNEWNNS
jgi:hypothetical protein